MERKPDWLPGFPVQIYCNSEVEEEKPDENSMDENAALLAKLLSNPETAALLKALAKTI